MEYHTELKVIALLEELVDEEGPQPGTSIWAEKVKEILREINGEDE